MSSEKQEILPLDSGLQSLYVNAGKQMLALVRRVIRESEAKQGDDFAQRLGITASHLSDALKDNGKHFALSWLPQVLHLDRQRIFLGYAAGLVNCRIVPRAPLTKAQRFDLVLAELKRGGADVGALEARAYQHAPEDDP